MVAILSCGTHGVQVAKAPFSLDGKIIYGRSSKVEVGDIDTGWAAHGVFQATWQQAAG